MKGSRPCVQLGFESGLYNAAFFTQYVTAVDRRTPPTLEPTEDKWARYQTMAPVGHCMYLKQGTFICILSNHCWD